MAWLRPADWMLAGAAAAVPCLVVLFADQFEGTLTDALGIDGGPMSMLVLVGIFVVGWVPAGFVLAAAASPPRAGVVAGGLVALSMLAVVIPIVRDHGWPVLLIWAAFAGLAVGMGAATGGIAGARRSTPGRGSRTAGIAAIVGGLVIAVVTFSPFFVPVGSPQATTFLVIVLLLATGLVVLGTWLLRQGQRKAS